MSNLFRANQDPFIMTILDKIFEVTQIDPASFSPDAMMCSDLGLTKFTVMEIFKRSAADLGLEFRGLDGFKDISPREMVTYLRSCRSTWASRAA